MPFILSAALAAAVMFQDPAAVSAALATNAFADPAAAELVTRARAARLRNERLVTDYTVNVSQRMGVGIRALRRDRMLFGQELSARIEWHRDGPSKVQVIGARQRVPVATRGDQIPDDLDASVEWLVLDPSADYLRMFGNDADGFSHPLRQGSEADYRFSSGDTTTLTLPNGRTLRLLELRVRPRRAEFNLMNGSLWFDADSYGVVRAVFAPARPFDIELDGDSGDADEIPGFVKPIRAEVKYVTIEYGLYELRWWMMRYFAFDAEAQASVMRIPMRFERVYEGYRVQGGTEPTPGARRPAGSIRERDRRGNDSTGAERQDSLGRVVRDSVARQQRDSLRTVMRECVRQKADSAQQTLEQQRGRSGARIEVRMSEGRYERLCRRDQRRPSDAWPIDVEVPDDSMTLLSSPTLGEPILSMGDVISENELRQLGREIGAIPQQPWQYRPQLPLGVGALLRHARYNRVEALSLGLAATMDFGRLRLDALGRIGVADLEPNGELGLTRPARNATFRLGAFRRLAAANPDTRPFGMINSQGALFLQRDDGEYYRTWGAELTATNANSGWWSARLFAERQSAAAVETNASLPRLFNKSRQFRPNIVAPDADQAGGSLTLRGSRALGRSVILGAEATVDGATGTFDFGRGTVTTRLNVAGVGPLALAFEMGAGTSSGGLPVQSRFYLGGPATLRGYTGGTSSGESFWRGRVEGGTRLPVARLLLFTDAGWAGDRALFSRGRPLWGAGVGVSFLDGLFRMDLGRRLSGPNQGFRFDFYLDGIM